MTTDFTKEVLRLTNEFRAKHGLQPLRLNEHLSEAAQTHTDNMAEKDFSGHFGPDGSTPWGRVHKTDYEGDSRSENITYFHRTPEAAVQSWINSPKHRGNMLNPEVNELGVGYTYNPNDTGHVNYGTYWTQVFGIGDVNDGDDTSPTPQPMAESNRPSTPVSPTLPKTSSPAKPSDCLDCQPAPGNTPNPEFSPKQDLPQGALTLVSGNRGTVNADELRGSEINETIRARGGNDLVHAGGGNDIIRGGSGDDKVFGEAGNDVIHAGSGNDIVSGGDGDDIIIGAKTYSDNHGWKGGQIDIFTGGAGADKFVLGNEKGSFYDDYKCGVGKEDYAIITDFNASEGDVIQLSAEFKDQYFVGGLSQSTYAGSGKGLMRRDPTTQTTELVAVLQTDEYFGDLTQHSGFTFV